MWEEGGREENKLMKKYGFQWDLYRRISPIIKTLKSSIQIPFKTLCLH